MTEQQHPVVERVSLHTAYGRYGRCVWRIRPGITHAGRIAAGIIDFAKQELDKHRDPLGLKRYYRIRWGHLKGKQIEKVESRLSVVEFPYENKRQSSSTVCRFVLYQVEAWVEDHPWVEIVDLHPEPSSDTPSSAYARAHDAPGNL